MSPTQNGLNRQQNNSNDDMAAGSSTGTVPKLRTSPANNSMRLEDVNEQSMVMRRMRDQQQEKLRQAQQQQLLQWQDSASA